jgi:coenzyme F420-0:L-glutamate ligase/coenzyme F420-1:gamma-L-glutamate ligase
MRAIPLDNLPLIKKGDNLGELIIRALMTKDMSLKEGDIIAVTEKIVATAEGRVVPLKSISPSGQANELAAATGKDPRIVELILRESDEILRVGDNFIIVVTKHGYVCANAGIDQSNIEPGNAKLLPINPDKSAAKIRSTLEEKYAVKLGVIVVDSLGRPFRRGSVGVALGCSGVRALLNMRGEKDLYGKELMVTRVAIADCLASSANLLMGEAGEKIPVVIIKGLNYQGDGRALDLLRTKTEDMFR